MQQSPNAFTDIERKRLRKAIESKGGKRSTRDLTMLAVLLGTGIRLSELTDLDVADVDMDGRRLTVRTKGGHTETRYISGSIRLDLACYMRQRAEPAAGTGALFLASRTGNRLCPRQVEERFALWLDWAGLSPKRFSVHSTRHTLATRIYEMTNDMTLVDAALGHRTSHDASRYVHAEGRYSLEDVLEAM